MADATATGEATVTISLDGAAVEAVSGEMIISAAERAGTFIPRFCYHPRMKPVGMCRMCLVEVKGPRGFSLQPACFVEVADGQEIVTSSPKVKKAQDGVLEYLLVNHPLDCPVCDKGGECPLQDQTLAYGPGESRFVEEKRHFEKPIPISELVFLDRERCIQCGRCTRFALEVAGDPLIDFLDRGDRLEVNTFPDQPFSSYFSGNTVQICPVGALTASPYRFRARPWDLEQVESTCTSCSLGCRVVVQASSNRLTRYLGVDSEPVNHGWLCDKGRFDFEAVNSEERLSKPLVRKGAELVGASWSAALEAAGSRLAEVRASKGPSSIGVIGGARLANEDAYAWAKLAKAVIGTDSVDSQLGDGLPAEVVLGLPRATVEEACKARLVVSISPDLREELPVLYLRLRQSLLEDGLQLLELSPTSTSLTPHARESLRHKPGMAAELARALVDSAEPGSDCAGVSLDTLARARRMIGADDGEGVVVVLGRHSLAESHHDLAEAAGELGDAMHKARFLPVLRRANILGALDMGLAPGVLPGRVGLEAGRAWFTKAWGSLPPSRGLDTAGILAGAVEGRISALVLVGADPLADFPDRELARAAIDALDALIAVDTFSNASVRQADVVLPAAMYSERPGTTTNIEGRVSRLGQMLVAPGVAWPDWVIAAELASRLGGDLAVQSLEDIWAEIEHLSPTHHGLTSEVLSSEPARDGIVVPLSSTGVRIRGSEGAAARPARLDPMATPGIDAVERQGAPSLAGRTQSAFTTDNGNVRAAQRPASMAFSLRGQPDGPDEVEHSEAGRSGERRDGTFALVSKRRLYDSGTLVSASGSLAPLAEGAVLRAAPRDLEGLGASVGDRVRARSATKDTELVVEAVADEAIGQGTVEVAFSAPGAAAAELIDCSQRVSHVRLEVAGAR